MSAPDVGVWRVVDTSGVVHAVTVHPRRPDWIASVDGPGYRASLGDEDEWGSTPRGAVLLLAASRRVEAGEIVAPGEMTRAEASAAASLRPPMPADEAAIAARAATYERVCQAYATADHGATSRFARLETDDAAHESAADVPALLAHIAAEPARVAAAVAGETARCREVCDAIAIEHYRGVREVRGDGAAECRDALAAPAQGAAP